jgi:hypothetical protein
MRALLLLGLMVLISAKAIAEQWQTIAEAQSVIAEIDADSIRPISKNIFEATFRFTHSLAQINRDSGATYFSAEVTSRFDCAGKKYAPFKRVEFAATKGKGAQIATVKIPEEKIKFTDIQPTSMNEIMYDRVCEISIERKFQ